ncbi:hypothetical protein CRUP_025579 [Coryphaenoides rupestris]|nr:hypothetical protein CRUP_025579 [Coryphaenoides rupestris]
MSLSPLATGSQLVVGQSGVRGQGSGGSASCDVTLGLIGVSSALSGVSLSLSGEETRRKGAWLYVVLLQEQLTSRRRRVTSGWVRFDSRGEEDVFGRSRHSSSWREEQGADTSSSWREEQGTDTSSSWREEQGADTSSSWREEQGADTSPCSQQLNNAQLHSLAAAQQASLAAGRQSSPSSSSSSLLTTTAANVTVSGGGAITSPRPIGQGPSATSTISQSVLLSGGAGRQGQMYLRVNRSLRAPISSQLIFMPGNTATMATVTQQPQAPQQPNQEVTATSLSSGQSDHEQVQNLALRGTSDPRGVGVKTEILDKTDSVSQGGTQQPLTKPPPHPLPHIKIPTYPQPNNLKASSSSIPLSQLLLHGPRTLSTVTAAATATHILVPTTGAQPHPHPHPHGYQATIKPVAGAQTLVVQPLQKASLGPDKPVPIQPKTLQGVRMPLQLPSRTPPPIRPAPPPPSSSSPSSSSQAAPPPPPHIPVQIVGARQSSLGTPAGLALARGPAAGPLLTMGASIASREGGVTACRGAGLKASQETTPLARVTHINPQANHNAGRGQNGTLTPSPPSSSSSQDVGVSSSSAPPLSSSSPLCLSTTLPLAPGDQRGALPGVTANGKAAGGTQGAVEL